MKYFEQLVFNTHGDIAQSRGVAHRGEFKGYYGIQYNHAGRVWLSRGGEVPQLAAGPHVFITYPGVDFEYGAPPGESRHHCFVCFSGSLIQRFIDGGLLELERKNPLIPIIYSEHFYAVFCRLRQLLRQPGGQLQPRAAHLLEDLLLQIQEQPGARGKINAYCEKELQNLCERIARKPLEKWDFAAEARRLSVSYPHFRRLFREVAGCAPNQFVIEAKLNLAERLLEDGVMPIAEVAHACGFADEFYFSRLFKRHRLISPSALRNSTRRLPQGAN